MNYLLKMLRPAVKVIGKQIGLPGCKYNTFFPQSAVAPTTLHANAPGRQGMAEMRNRNEKRINRGTKVV